MGRKITREFTNMKEVLLEKFKSVNCWLRRKCKIEKELTDKNIDMKDELNEIFKIVNNLLKYAEAKNATVIALTSGIIYGTLRLMKGTIPEFWTMFGYCFVGVGAIVLIMAFISLLPILNRFYSTLKNETGECDNVYFFMDIKDYKRASDYLNLLYQKAGIEYKENKLEVDLANQIIVNSQITYRKFQIFKLILYTYLWGTVLSLVIAGGVILSAL